MTQQVNHVIQMNRNGIYINGKSEIILCSSLFYFRIPKGLWKDRLKKVKEAGYNCIDVYFPWNYHEIAPGEWDFTGEKDVEEFLQLAREENLWVIARPGPYICSEWDGGGLPAYLFTDQSMKVRDNDPTYLAYVSKWFDQILPVLRKYEQGNEGTIITIQMENELDFYTCDDREGYISALQEMAEQHQISVPLFACAGQGDIFGATGFAENIMPACNFYPHDKDPHVEARALPYYNQLREQNYPLCVSETNRSHYLLRRLLSAGTKMLGPYNQVSGTDFGFTNGINNWGDPLALLTSDYDFGGMVSPEGIRRPEYHEARLLSQFISSLGTSFAEATLCTEKPFTVQSEMTKPDHGPYALSLKDGGKVLFVPNLDEVDHQAVITSEDDTFPQHVEFTIPVNRCPMILYDVPMETWNLTGTLKYSTAELGYVNELESQTTMVFHTENKAEICMEFKENIEIISSDIQVNNKNGRWILNFTVKQVEDNHQHLTIKYKDGSILKIVCMNRMQAANVKEISPNDEIILFKEVENERRENKELPIQTDWKYYEIEENEWLKDAQEVNQPVALEHKEYYRGYGWYSSKYNNDQLQPIKGIMLHGASDVISLYCNSNYQGTTVPGGGFQYYPLENTLDNLDIRIRSEIWGHSNFNSPLLPSLALNSLKGIDGLTIVHKHEVLENEWNYLPVDHEFSKVPMIDYENPLWKTTKYDGFLTNSQPKKGYYHRRLSLSKDYDHHLLSFEGIESTGKVYIDGVFVDYINPFNPYINISNHLLDQEITDIVVYLEQYYNESGGIVSLLSGNESQQWKMYGLEEKGLSEKSDQYDSVTRYLGQLPLHMPGGEIGWLNTGLKNNEESKKCLIGNVSGENAKLTVFFNQTIIGRIWLPSEMRPVITGGAQSRFYLPSTLWEEDDNKLKILIEAIDLNYEATVEKIQFKEV